jgi:hypothetical protein
MRNDTGREHDIKELVNQLNRETRPETRRTLNNTIQKIRNESGLVRSMRESLIKAHRSGNVQNVKDIHDFIKNKEKYG